MQIFGLVAFIEQKENDNNDNLCKIHGGLYIASALNKLLDKGHEAENLQKECLFLLYYHFPMEDFGESFGNNTVFALGRKETVSNSVQLPI